MQIFANSLKLGYLNGTLRRATHEQLVRGSENSRQPPIKKRRLQSLADTLSRKRGVKVTLPRISIQETDNVSF